MKPVVAVMTDIWPSASQPHNGPYLRELTSRLAESTRQLVLVPRLLLPRVHRRVWGDAVQGWQRGHDEPADDVRVVPYPMLRIPKGTETRARVAGARLAIRASRERPALVHGHFLYAVGPASVRLARRLGVPAVLTAHGTDVRWLGDRRAEVQRRHHDEMVEACLEADAITVVAAWMVQHFTAVGVPEHRITALPMGVDESVFRVEDRGEARKRLGVGRDERIVLFVGRATPEKGAGALREALDNLAARGLRLRCCVAGPVGLAGTTHLGMLEPKALAAWFAAADVMCLPSRSEGMPVAVSESLACGRPVVATAVGGMVEQIQPGTNGLLVEPGDDGELADALAEALEGEWDPEAIRATSERFWWSTIAPGVAALYERLLSAER